MVKRHKPSLEDCVDAIIARDSGMPYEHVLKAFDISPNQFFFAAKKDIRDYIKNTSGDTKTRLNEIANSPPRTIELFNMGQKVVETQYDSLMNGNQSRLWHGTLVNRANVNTLIYYALGFHNPLLRSNKRREVIEGVKNLSSDLQAYLQSLKLSGLMGNLFHNSPVTILKIFNQAYQDKTGDKSLYDLSQPEHLHRWVMFKAPQGYWKEGVHTKEAVYHTLTEMNPELASDNRDRVIQAVQIIPSNLYECLVSNGLSGLLDQKVAIPSILTIFDRAYQERTGNPGLFDSNQNIYLELNSEPRIPSGARTKICRKKI